MESYDGALRLLKLAEGDEAAEQSENLPVENERWRTIAEEIHTLMDRYYASLVALGK